MKIKHLLFMFLLLFVFTIKVNAFSITGQTSVTVGSNVSVKIEASGLIGRFDISAQGAITGSKSVWLENNMTTLTFSANQVGNASITVDAKDVSDENGNTFTGKRILYITVKDKQTITSSGNKKPSVDINKKYSSNNYLKSLNIDGYDLEPIFNKNTLEYNVTLNVDTELIKINAETEDSKATLKGIGEVKVSDGTNEINITVTAENGNEKTYKINATVKEADPINVTYDNKKYTVVRKPKLENIPTGFVQNKININNQNIDSYYSDVAKITLVVLKDTNGKEKLFSYNNNKYVPFNEAKSSGLNLMILDEIPNISRGFKKTTINLNGNTVTAYKTNFNNNYYLIYAKDLSTGKKDIYLYDKENNIFESYFSDLIDNKDKEITIREYIIIGLLSLLGLIIVTKILTLLKSKDKKIIKYEKKISKLKNKINKNISEDYINDTKSYDIDDVDEKPVIKQIEDDKFSIPKKSRKEKLKEKEEVKKRLEKTKPSFRRVSLEDDD